MPGETDKCTFCATVYKKDPAGGLFCPNCGYRPDATAAPVSKPAVDREKEKSKEKWMLILKIIAYGAMFCTIVYMLTMMFQWI